MTHLKIRRFCTKPISSFSQSKRGQLQPACTAAAPSAGQGLSVHHTPRDGLHSRHPCGLSAPRTFGSEAPWGLPCTSLLAVHAQAPHPRPPCLDALPSASAWLPHNPLGSLPVAPRSGGPAGPPLSSRLTLPRLPSQAASPSALKILSAVFFQNNA